MHLRTSRRHCRFFFWLFVAFFLLMIVEGLRASFFPRQITDQTEAPETKRANWPSPSLSTPANFETALARAQRLHLMKNRKLIDRRSRSSQAFRPTIRRTFSPLETETTHDDEHLSDRNDRVLEFR